MHVHIFVPAKSTMQSGRGKVDQIIMEPAAQGPRRAEPVMGWVSGPDTKNQLRLVFPTLQAAVDHATRQGWTHTVQTGATRRVRPRNYTDNFKATLTLDGLLSRKVGQETA